MDSDDSDDNIANARFLSDDRVGTKKIISDDSDDSDDNFKKGELPHKEVFQMNFELFKVLYLTLLNLYDYVEEVEGDPKVMATIDYLEKIVDLYRIEYLH